MGPNRKLAYFSAVVSSIAWEGGSVNACDQRGAPGLAQSANVLLFVPVVPVHTARIKPIRPVRVTQLTGWAGSNGVSGYKTCQIKLVLCSAAHTTHRFGAFANKTIVCAGVTNNDNGAVVKKSMPPRRPPSSDRRMFMGIRTRVLGGVPGYPGIRFSGGVPRYPGYPDTRCDFNFNLFKAAIDSDEPIFKGIRSRNLFQDENRLLK
eukprot:2665492-Rhodomonas_salina.4